MCIVAFEQPGPGVHSFLILYSTSYGKRRADLALVVQTMDNAIQQIINHFPADTYTWSGETNNPLNRDLSFG